MKTQTRIVCFTGPSGVGKTSFAKRLMAEHGFILPIVATTRQPRSDDDERYRYVTEAAFMAMINSGSFLEWDKYTDYYYGTLQEAVTATGSQPGIVLDLTPNGCSKVREAIPAAIIIALLPDDPAWLFERLKSRNSQSPEEILSRTKLLESYLSEIDSLPCSKVSVSFSPDSWDSTFQAIKTIVFADEQVSS